MAEVTGVADIVGAMRWPEPPGWFVAAQHLAGSLVRARSPGDGRGQGLGRGRAVLYRAGGAGAARRRAQAREPLKVNLPNNHLQYALTWFGLAAVLLAVFAAWVLARRREGRTEPR